MDKMDLHQTDNKALDILLFLLVGLIWSEIWKELLSSSIHTIGVCITVVLSGLIGYMAKNFWFPYWFPKDGDWKFFNFLKPKSK